MQAGGWRAATHPKQTPSIDLSAENAHAPLGPVTGQRQSSSPAYPLKHCFQGFGRPMCHARRPIAGRSPALLERSRRQPLQAGCGARPGLSK